MSGLQLMRQLLGAVRTPSFAVVSLGLMLMPAVAVGQSVEERIDALTRELEALRLGGDVIEADSSIQGLGPAASRVYRIDQGVSIGGYGEFLYENYSKERQNGAASGSTDKFDALRAIIYMGYKFNDRLLFNSEIEIEHAKEIYLEFAYIDYLLTDNFGLRAGMLLAPLGLVNELHEPPIFLGTERPLTENKIIPTTWRENGIGLFGGNENIAWRAYMMNSLKGSGFKGSGLRGGRQKGAKAEAESFGYAGRVDYIGTPGLIFGASAYTGDTGQGSQLNGQDVGGATTIWDLHLDYKASGFDFRALMARASVSDVVQLNELNGLTGSSGIGSALGGWYLQGGYDLLANSQSAHQFIPFVRYEKLNTQQEVPAGFTKSASNDMTVTSIGAMWKPENRVMFEADFQIHSNGANTGINQWNMHMGWLF